MARVLTIDILFDALQIAVEKDLIQEWSVAGSKVVLTRSDHSFSLPVLEARDYLRQLFREHERTKADVSEVQDNVLAKRREYVMEGLLDDDLGVDQFRSLVHVAVRDLMKVKSRRLQRIREERLA